MLAGGRSLSHEAQLAGANLLNLPFVDASFDGVFMFFGALQHIPGRDHRRRALAEMARVTRPHGRLILGLDNVAPGLACYRYWLAQKLRPPAAKPTSTHHHTAPLDHRRRLNLVGSADAADAPACLARPRPGANAALAHLARPAG
ncbi:MAG: methyltransferase domain-containing protein [Anaerolineales bacterium]|nr:methyltransferase domain-containing protein [Anaerolineales bacterium]